jgi:DNA-binding response OmpR family regulator
MDYGAKANRPKSFSPRELVARLHAILTSLEMRMKRGIGKYGRSNREEKSVCRDGPVFSLAELDKLAKEY